MYLFIYETESKQTGERGRGKGRERILSRLYAQPGAQHWAGSHAPGIMTWAEIKSQMLNWLSHQGAPPASTTIVGKIKM